MNKIKLCLWFDGQAEEAATFYVTLLPDSQRAKRAMEAMLNMGKLEIVEREAAANGA